MLEILASPRKVGLEVVEGCGCEKVEVGTKSAQERTHCLGLIYVVSKMKIAIIPGS